jgi:hypothetical protein
LRRLAEASARVEAAADAAVSAVADAAARAERASVRTDVVAKRAEKSRPAKGFWLRRAICCESPRVMPGGINRSCGNVVGVSWTGPD